MIPADHLRLGLALFALSSGLVTQATPSHAGCYEFDRWYFTWVYHIIPGPMKVDSSRTLRLLPTTSSRLRAISGQVFDVRPVPFVADSLAIQRWGRLSYWTVSDSGELNISWRNGLYGPVFRFKAVGDTLQGEVRFTTDVVGAEPPLQKAWARRIACPEP